MRQDTDIEVEIGYRFRKTAWGQGYATEGARALVHKGVTEVGVQHSESRLVPGGQRPAEVIVDIEVLLDAEIDWTPPVLAVYHAGCLRPRRS